MRVFPLSNWTELDVWQYIQREGLELPSIYFAHQRPIVRRQGSIVPVTPITPAREGETVVDLQVRFRTVGDITCTAPVESDADTVAKIIAETATTQPFKIHSGDQSFACPSRQSGTAEQSGETGNHSRNFLGGKAGGRHSETSAGRRRPVGGAGV